MDTKTNDTPANPGPRGGPDCAESAGSAKDDLKERVDAFHCMELPGQPLGMHMGTSHLVADLWREVIRLRAHLKETLPFLEQVCEADAVGGPDENCGVHRAETVRDAIYAISQNNEITRADG